MVCIPNILYTLNVSVHRSRTAVTALRVRRPMFELLDENPPGSRARRSHAGKSLKRRRWKISSTNDSENRAAYHTAILRARRYNISVRIANRHHIMISLYAAVRRYEKIIKRSPCKNNIYMYIYIYRHLRSAYVRSSRRWVRTWV